MRVRAWVAAAGICAFSGAVLSAGLAACSSTTITAGVIPLTGITIPASSLTSGIGCGTGPGQVYKYAAALQDPPFGRVYDCYADAAFVNLTSQADGGDDYTVFVFLYDADSYNANAAAINAAVSQTDAVTELSKISSTFMTTCTGTQIYQIQSVAQCARVSAGGPGSLQIATNAFSLADGGSIACGSGYNFVFEGPFDGGTLVTEAGAYSVCPAPIAVGPFPALTQVTAPVTVFQTNTVIGTTTCRGTVLPNNGASPATCDPLVLP